MRKPTGWAIVLGMLLGGAGALRAADTRLDVSAGVFSHYVWRGIQLSEGRVLQPEVVLGHRGFSIGLWGNYDFEDSKINEVDLTLAWDTTIDRINLQLGYCHYFMVDVVDSDELFAKVSVADLPVEPSLALYVDVNEGKGAYLVAGLSRGVPLAPTATLNLEAAAGFVVRNGYMALDDEGREFTDLFDGHIGASLDLSLGERVTLTPAIGAAFGLSRNARHAIRNGGFNDRSSTVYGGVTLAVSF